MEDMSPQFANPDSMPQMSMPEAAGPDQEAGLQTLQQEVATLEGQEESLADQQEQVKDSNIDNQEQSLVEMSQEELQEKQEKIQERILEIQKEQELRALRVEFFSSEIKVIMETFKDPAEQMKVIVAKKLLELLPENMASLIEENYAKYNFIDFKAVDISLEEDQIIATELESLNQQSSAVDSQLEMFEMPEVDMESPVDMEGVEDLDIPLSPVSGDNFEQADLEGLIPLDVGVESVPQIAESTGDVIGNLGNAA